jgi:hypothetical protein
LGIWRNWFTRLTENQIISILGVLFFFDFLIKICYNIYRKLRKELIFMFFKKAPKGPTEKDIALMDMLDAREEYERVLDLFGWANEEYFEIANMELTIAKLKYEVSVKKVLMLCKDGKDLPKIGIISERVML